MIFNVFAWLFYVTQMAWLFIVDNWKVFVTGLIIGGLTILLIIKEEMSYSLRVVERANIILDEMYLNAYMKGLKKGVEIPMDSINIEFQKMKTQSNYR